MEPYLVSELVEADFRDVDAVDENRTLGRLNEPEQAEHQRRLSGPGATDDPDFLAARDLERHLLQDQVQTLPSGEQEICFIGGSNKIVPKDKAFRVIAFHLS